MEEYVRKEIEDICRDILDATEPTDFKDQLEQVQSLYEKLLVLNYLNSGKKSTIRNKVESQPSERRVEPQSPISHPAVESSVSNPVPAAPPAEPLKMPEKEIINESPVVEKELIDDKTPEQQLEEVLRSKSEAVPPKNSSINERYGSGAIKLGLNDRLAFVNHLFAGQQEDLNRVISQINTFETYQEAEDFIENMIKPDYDWSQKEEFVLRFMSRVKQKFGEESY